MKKEHVHTYRRFKQGSIHSPYIIFRCMEPRCSHFVHEDLIVGRECLCYICGKSFILLQKHKRMRRPHCANCKARYDMNGKIPKGVKVSG